MRVALILALFLTVPELVRPLGDPGNYGLVPEAEEPGVTMLAKGSED
jgi:hypothetical protein